MPKTITCRVMSIDMLKTLTGISPQKGDAEQVGSIDEDHTELVEEKLKTLCDEKSDNSLVLAGLHACGDLSVTMLKLVPKHVLKSIFILSSMHIIFAPCSW